MKSPKDILLSALRHEPVDRVPWVPLLGSVNVPSFLPEQLQERNDDVAVGQYLQESLGCDILVQRPTVRCVRGRAVSERHAEDDRVVVETRIENRSLRTVSRLLAFDGLISQHIEHYPVKTAEDRATLRLIVEDERWAPDAERWEETADRLGGGGVVNTTASPPPLNQLILHLAGLESTMFALADDAAGMEELMGVMHEKNLEQYRAIMESRAEVVRCTTDDSTLLQSPDQFRRYCLPCLRDYAELCHRHGRVFMVHTCGHIRDFLPMYREAGVDAIHYVTAPPTGNTPVAAAREAWGRDVTIMAAVDPLTLESGAPGEASGEVRRILDEAGDTEALVVMTSSKPAVKEACLRAVSDTLQERSQRGMRSRT